MKTHPRKLAALLLSACCFTPAAIYAATMASQPWVTNRIAEAEARTDAKIIAATNAIPRADLTAATNYTDAALGAFASTGAVARATSAISSESSGSAGEAVSATWASRLSDGGSVGADNFTYAGILAGFAAGTNYTDAVAAEFSDGTRTVGYSSYSDTSGLANSAGSLIGDGDAYNATALIRESTNAAVAVADAKISTNNAAFVSAVLAVPLTGADAGDLAEIAEYGGYGTVGAALLALIAGLAALKRRVTSAETALAGKMPMYPMVAVTPSSGTLTVTPYTVATYTADTSAAAFTVAVGTGTAGKARDCELVIDCTGSGAVAPTVTWPSNFHPRTDAATDFACETGVRNVYFISEYAAGEFAVGGWQETAGGNA